MYIYIYTDINIPIDAVVCVSLRQHTYINIPIDAVVCVSIRQHTYIKTPSDAVVCVSIRQHTYINIPIDTVVCDVEGAAARQEAMRHIHIHRILVTVTHVLDYYSQSSQRWTAQQLGRHFPNLLASHTLSPHTLVS